MPIKLIHCADLHLDSPFDYLPERKAAERRYEQYGILESIIMLAESRCADALIISGDLFDKPAAAKAAVRRTAELLGSCPAEVFISPGNHDFLFSGSPYRERVWPANVHIFTGNNISGVERVRREKYDIYGCAFTDPYQKDPLIKDFKAERGRISIMALHAELQSPEQRYSPITPELISATQLTYLALGHNHRCDGLRRAGGTAYAYCGCPEGRGFDETGVKGVLYVEIDDSGETSAELLPLGGREYRELRIDLTGCADIAAAVMDRLPAGSEKDLFRITLTGECGDLDRTFLEQLLSERTYFAKIYDRIRLPKDIWADAGSDSPAGIFLRRLKAISDGELTELAARYGLAALAGEEEPFE